MICSIARVRGEQLSGRLTYYTPQHAAECCSSAGGAALCICLQAWYAAHPPKRGIPLIHRPYVHQAGIFCSSTFIAFKSATVCSSSRPMTLEP